MSKQKKAGLFQRLTYWDRFLRFQNLELLEPVEQTEAMGELPNDPEFLEFLKVASTYGAPKSMGEFKKLSREDKLFYLGAYQEYLKEEQKRKRAKR